MSLDMEAMAAEAQIIRAVSATRRARKSWSHEGEFSAAFALAAAEWDDENPQLAELIRRWLRAVDGDADWHLRTYREEAA